MPCTSSDNNRGKGGIAHRYWQAICKLEAEGEGWHAVIEEPIPGSTESVDLGLIKAGKRLAVEISVTTKAKQESSNVRKCLESGYDHVILLFIDETKLTQFQNLLKDFFTQEEQSKISAGLVYDFCSFLR